MLGREVRLPCEIVAEGNSIWKTQETTCIWGEYALNVRERLQKAHCVARKHLQVNAKRRKDFYDSNSKLLQYKVGEKVWYLNENRKVGDCPKLQPLYMGPCLITKKINDLNYEIQMDGMGKERLSIMTN